MKRSKHSGLLTQDLRNSAGMKCIESSMSHLLHKGSPYQRPPMSKVVAMLTGDVEVAEVVTKPNYITEWQFRGGNTSYVTSHSGSTTPELSRQKEIDPLTQSPTITGVSHEHEGR